MAPLRYAANPRAEGGGRNPRKGRDQILPSGNLGQGYWWKFEKELSASEAYSFAQTHGDPDFADDHVAGERVRLTYMGTTNCDINQNYNCAHEGF